jgi:type I restriction-modification system DNA methylase subunit
MIRYDIISLIGRDFLQQNLEKDGEWSYGKALGRKIEKIENEIAHQFLDIRFVKDNVSVLVETKQSFIKKDEKQLFNYVVLEKELEPNHHIIAILTNTKDDRIKVWADGILQKDKKIKTIDEYVRLFDVSKINNKEKVMQATFKLNEMLHKNDISEDLRSQFVGTCLLALDNKSFQYNKDMATKVIIAGIKDVLNGLLSQDASTERGFKLQLLSTNVLDTQKIRTMSSANFAAILDYIYNNIRPYINNQNNMGQDLLNLFFTTFNKYVGKKDKNQAFTPDHIVHFMCKIADINKNSVALDPTCGSGAFLVQAMTQALNNCENDKEKKEIKQQHIFGIELEEKAFGLSTTNMLIHGDGNSNVINGSCFDKSQWIKDANINTILMNPPYNAN